LALLPPIPLLIRCDVTQRDTSKPTPTDNAQLTGLDKAANGALVNTKNFSSLAGSHADVVVVQYCIGMGSSYGRELMQCPKCQGTCVIKNGTIHNGKPKWKCKDCARQFVANPTHRQISDETKQLVDKLLLERISLSGIVRVTGVSLRWLQYYVNAKYATVPRSVTVREQKKGA
jgi:hypothetical protein